MEKGELIMEFLIYESFVKDYQTYLLSEERSTKTIEKYLRDIHKFYDFMDGDILITKTKVLEFKEMLTKNYKPASTNSILVALNGFWDFLSFHELKVKLLKMQRRIICDEAKELTKAEYNRLLQSAKEKKNKRLYVLLQTICSTGIRVSEHRYLTVESLKEGRAYINNKGKIRIIFIQKKLRKMLSSYCKEEHITTGPIFITRSGKALDRSNIWTMMKDLCVDAKVERTKVFPHNLRHLFAFTYYRLEKDLVRLADILGHSSIETTRIYTMTTGIEYERQLSRLDLISS